MPDCKTCPKCKETKSFSEYYKVKSRSDGHASWCKSCSNKSRKHHKKTNRDTKRKEYSEVAKASSQKPTTCPSCNTENVPSHKMRGRLEADKVVWECLPCRTSTLVEEKKVTCYCDWCCDPFSATPATQKRFCGEECLTAWRMAVKARKQKLAKPEDMAVEIKAAPQPAIPTSFKRVRFFRPTETKRQTAA